MKSKILNIALFLFLLNFPAFTQQVSFTIFHVSDSHSQLDGMPTSTRTEGGISRIANIVKQTKLSDPNTLFFHSGDFMVGDFFFNYYFGVPELLILKNIGCDGLAIGNHEFDLGPQYLCTTLSEASRKGLFPIVSSNLDLTGYPQLNNYITPFYFKNISGIKLGVFALTTPDPLNSPYPVIVKDSILQIASQTVQVLKSNGASIIILLSHLGFNADSVIASNIPDINFILGGHDHYTTNQLKQVVNPLGKITYICHSGDYYRKLGKIKFTYSAGLISIDNFQMLGINSSLQQDEGIQNTVNGFKPEIEFKYGNVFSEVLGTATGDIVSEINYDLPSRDVPLGNLVTDAYKFKTNTEIGITARGLISGKLFQGSILGADILRCVPYGYDTATGLGMNLVTCEITGAQLYNALEIVLEAANSSESFMPQVAGLTFDYNPQSPLGQKILLPTLKVNGVPLNHGIMYSLTINEIGLKILQSFGTQIQNIVFTHIPEYSALKEKISSLNSVIYSYEGRIRDINFVSNIKKDFALNGFTLYDNYPNPFNSSTIIKFYLPVNDFVSIKIYDVSGRLISVLLSSNLNSGYHNINFNANDFSSGVYFYTISTKNISQTKRMLLIR